MQNKTESSEIKNNHTQGNLVFDLPTKNKIM